MLMVSVGKGVRTIFLVEGRLGNFEFKVCLSLSQQVHSQVLVLCKYTRTGYARPGMLTAALYRALIGLGFNADKWQKVLEMTVPLASCYRGRGTLFSIVLSPSSNMSERNGTPSVTPLQTKAASVSL